MSPGFEKLLDRARSLYLFEMRNGCVDCLEDGGYCDRHREIAFDVGSGDVTKYLSISPNGKVRYLINPGEIPGG